MVGQSVALGVVVEALRVVRPALIESKVGADVALEFGGLVFLGQLLGGKLEYRHIVSLIKSENKLTARRRPKEQK
jgi:hypothetical protein